MTRLGEALLTVREVADFLSVSPKTVYRRVWSGELPAVKLGSVVRIPMAELRKFLKGLPEITRPEVKTLRR